MARVRADNVAGTIVSELASTATSFSAPNVAKLPAVSAPDVAAITLVDSSGNYEIVHVVAHEAVSTTATVLRAQEGTTAQTFPAGSTFFHGPTATDFAELGVQVAVVADTQPDAQQDARTALYVDYKAAVTNSNLNHDALFVYSRPSLDQPAARVSGVRVTGIPSGAVPPDEQTGIYVRWDAAVGIVTPLLVGVYGHVGVVGGTVTEARAFVADISQLFGAINSGTGFYMAVNNSSDPWTFKTGNFKSQHQGPIAIGGATLGTAPNAGASLDLQHTNRALILNRLTTAQRAALTPVEGMLVYNTDLDHVEGYIDSAWRPLVDVGGATMTGPLTLSDGYLAASTNYVDNKISGLIWKDAVRVATTANITLSGEQTIDGILTAGSRVLVKNQTTQSQNGIYVSAAGAWARAADMDAGAEFVGAAVLVSAGTTQSGSVWVCQNSTAPTVGTTAVTFAQFSGGTITADGTSVTLTGNVLSRNALTGDVTATSGSSSTTVARIRGVDVDATAPTSGQTLRYINTAWKPVAAAGAREWRLDDPALGTAFDLTGSAASDAAWDALWSQVNEGDTIIVPAGAVIKFTSPKFLDKRGITLTSATEGPRQTTALGSINAARFVASGAGPWPFLFCIEGIAGATGANNAAEDSQRSYVTVSDLAFDGNSLCRDVVVWNSREGSIQNCTVVGLADGTTGQAVALTTLSSGIRVGPDDTSVSVTGAGSTSTVAIDSFWATTGSKVKFTAQPSTSLTLNTNYYLRRVNSTTVSVHTTRANAVANTAPVTLASGSYTMVKASTAQDIDVINCRVRGETASSYAQMCAGVIIYKAADCSIKDNCKMMRVTVGAWISAATCRYIDNHPYNGGIGRDGDSGRPGDGGKGIGYADLILSGQNHIVVNNYFDNPGMSNENGLEEAYATSASLTELAQAGAHIVLDGRSSWVRGSNISNNMFNNGDGGTDCKPAIRIRSTGGRVANIKIDHNVFRSNADVINNDNGATNLATSGRLRNVGSLFTFYNQATGGSAANHLLKQYQPVRFTAVPAGSGLSTTTTYFVRHGTTAASTFTLHATRANAIANQSAINPGGNYDTGWQMVGYRVSLFQGLIVADDWTYGATWSVTNNYVNWIWDPRYIYTSGDGSTEPFHPFVDLTSPSTFVLPGECDGNQYMVGNSITSPGSSDDRAYRDSPLPPLMSWRTSDTALTTSTTLGDDDKLQMPVLANTTYLVEAYLPYLAPASDTDGDFKLSFRCSSTGAVMTWTPNAVQSASSSTSGNRLSTVVALGGVATIAGAEAAGSPVDVAAMPVGRLTTGTTAGTFALQYAKGAHATGAGVKILAGAWLRLTPVRALQIGEIN